MSGIGKLNPDNVRYIAVHCSATPPDMDIGVKELDRMHRERGFLKIGYHKVIRRSGVIEHGRALDEIGAHVEGYNSQSIGVCLVGGVERAAHAKRDAHGELISLVPHDNFTLDQYAALGSLVLSLRLLYPKAVVQGHRDFPNVRKECPCFDVRTWFKETVDVTQQG